MNMSCLSGPMKTHLWNCHLIQTCQEMSCCLFTLLYYILRLRKQDKRTSIQFKLKCLLLDKSMLKGRENNLKSRYYFPSRNFLLSPQTIKWNFKIIFGVMNAVSAEVPVYCFLWWLRQLTNTHYSIFTTTPWAKLQLFPSDMRKQA